MRSAGGLLGGPGQQQSRIVYSIEKKVEKLVRDLQEVCWCAFMSPRTCSKARGKLSNYSFCLQRIRPFIVPFNVSIGEPQSNCEWDRTRDISEEMRYAGSFLLRHMDTLVNARSSYMASSSLHLVRSLHVERTEAFSAGEDKCADSRRVS